MNDIKKALEKRIDKLFEPFPGPIDWADVLARRVVAIAIDVSKVMEDVNDALGRNSKWTESQEAHWSLACALAPELRGLRRQARDAETIYVEGKVDSARRKLREQFASPAFMAEFIRDAASHLDGRGMASEANVLRDAAAIMDTEFPEKKL